MHAPILWRLLVALLLVAGSLALPILDHQPPVAVAQDDDDDGGEDDDGGDGDDDGDDGDDGNQGGGEKNDGGPDNVQPNPVEPAAGYSVEVACATSGDDAWSQCLFTIVEPPSAKKVTHLVLPESSVCSDVTGGDFRFVDPDPNVGLDGYRATRNGTLSLILEGDVSVEGTTTYWLKTGDAVFPAPGMGLACAQPAAESTPAGSDDAGAVLVSSYACAGAPPAGEDFDWYGGCEAGGDHLYELAPADAGKDDLLAAETSQTGEATFEGVQPGTYTLDNAGANWCHAESDNVNSDGEVRVEPGEETTVWLFYCEAPVS